MSGADLLVRLREKLLEAVAVQDGDAEPLTIGDIYQRLIPYRSVRGEMGVMELATYEHALLRLFAGEGNRLQLEREAVAEEFRKELSSTNPILGIYRDYPDVRLTLSPLDAAVAGAKPPDAIGAAAAAEEAIGTLRRTDPPPSADSGPSERTCSGCTKSLPSVEGLRFCPFCGRPSDPPPCTQCGTRLDPSWNFCISCGTPAAR